MYGDSDGDGICDHQSICGGNFADENQDGICDNRGRNTCKGQGCGRGFRGGRR